MSVIHWYHAEDYGVIATWQGGEYVQLYSAPDGVGRAAQILWEDDVPFDVINVWDYAKGCATITPEGLQRCVDAALRGDVLGGME